MSQEEKKSKSKKLRPLKIVLVILAIILFIIILDRLPTSKSSRYGVTASKNAGEPAPEGKEYYFLQGFLDVLENEVIDRLKELGVPEEEYDHVVEYLTKEELKEFEARIKLASSLENTYVEIEKDDKETLEKIFKLDHGYTFERFQKSEVVPSEYVIFKDLLKEYQDNLSSDDEN